MPDLPATVPANPLALAQAMIEKGADPDALKKVLDLVERWQANRAREAWYAGMNRCQGKTPVVVCDATNPQTKSKYPSLENVGKLVRPIYTAEGFSLCFGEGDSPLPNYCRTICKVNHELGHSEEFFLDLPLDGVGIKGNAMMTPVHGKLSSDSYAQRRLTCKIFNLVIADEDNDGNGPNISPDEIGVINDMLLEKGADLKKFLEWLQVESLDKIPRSRLAFAIDGLRRKSGGKRTDPVK